MTDWANVVWLARALTFWGSKRGETPDVSILNRRNGCCVVQKGYIFGTKGVLVIFCIEVVVCGVCERSRRVQGYEGPVFWFAGCLYRIVPKKTTRKQNVYRSCFLIWSSLVVTDVTWAFIAHMISMDKIIPARAKDVLFSKTVWMGSGPPSFLFNGYWASFHGINRPEREVDHLHSSTAEVTNEWSCTSSSIICLYGVDRY